MRKNIFKKTLTLSILVIATFPIVQWQRWSFGSTNYVDTIEVPWAPAVWSQAASEFLLTDIIQNAVNRILWILALIALIILLYAGFLMLTAAGDEEKYNKWFTILKYVAIWLIFIGLARFMVSMIFFLIDVFTQ